MSSPDQAEVPPNEELTPIEGAAFMATGAALVVHILFDVPLWASALSAVGAAALVILLVSRRHPEGVARGRDQIRIGFVVAVAALIAYDSSRYALMVVFDLDVHPFKAFTHFGEGLLGSGASTTAHWVAGTTLHIVNGITFGIAYTVLAGRKGVWWGIAFGLGLEAVMLGLYPAWLQIPNMQEFVSMSIFGHIAYGAVLGAGAKWAFERRDRSLKAALTSGVSTGG